VLSIQNVQGRGARSLGGRWHVIVDPYRSGAQFLGFPNARGFHRNLSPRDDARIEYDFARSPTLAVPGDWNSQDPRLLLYEGTVWYQRSFEAHPAAGRRTFLHFGAANYEAEVWVNGEAVGGHVGGFTPFDLEVTAALHEGENVVVASVDATRRRDGVPALDTDWWNYGGLTRDVLLVEVPESFVCDYRVGLDGIEVEVQGTHGPAPAQRVRIEIDEDAIELVTDAHGVARAPLPFTPERWSPSRPRLYDVTLACNGEVVRDRIGFRTIGTRGGEILLNDEPVFLRGISIHEEAPLRSGRARGEDDARVLLRWAQELGCNFVRLSHYPHDETMARVADELGLLVWEEVPVYWEIDWESPVALECATGQLRELILRDRNRASVIFWSLANETLPKPARLEFLRSLAATARALDPTRLLTTALLTLPTGDRKMRIDDPLGEIVDVLAVNEYFGWYYGEPEGVVWENAFGKPLVMSELGADALAGHHGDPGERYTEEFQARFYERQIAMLETIPFLRGLSPWILQDFRSPRRNLPGIQDHYNRKGLVSERGQRKLAFHVLRAWYERLAAERGGPGARGTRSAGRARW
jgi:beta-glucuronidase